jgi:hypothetical protein
MRIQQIAVPLVTIMLALGTLAAVGYAHRFPLSAQAESVGFDALAHELFGGVRPKQQ